MKKYYIITVIVLCSTIIGLSMFNSISYNRDKKRKDSIEVSRDSLLLRQSKVYDSLLQKIVMLDSIFFDHKSTDSTIKVDIQQIKYNSKMILNLQKQILLKNK